MCTPLAILLLLASAARAQAAAAEFAVVVNPALSVSGLSLADLRKIYLGDRQFWNPSQRINLLIRAPVTRERAAIVWTVCKMSESEFAKHWIGKVMRADCAIGPRQFSSNQSALELVNALGGAIAVVNAAQLPPGMKVVAVDGRMPGQPGYALRIGQ